MRPRLMAMINEAKKQSKAKRKKIVGKCPKTLMMSPKQAHFYLASLSEDQRALLHYCDRMSPAFILPSSTLPMIAMPYVFPAAELLLANKFYLRSLINTLAGNPKNKMKHQWQRFGKQVLQFLAHRSRQKLVSGTAGALVVITVHSIHSHFLLRSPIKQYSLFPWCRNHLTIYT